MRAVWAIALAAAVGTAAYAESRVYYPGLTDSDNPDAAEQRAFVETIFRGWEVRVANWETDLARCTPLLKELKAGTNVTYLEPVAFGATEKPQAVLDIEKLCPHLYLDQTWENHGSDPTAQSLDFVEPVTAEDKTSIYGEPYQMTRNFKLYRVPVPVVAEPRALFLGDRNCLRGNCGMGTSYRLIDEKQCRFENGMTLFPYRDKEGNHRGPALLWTVVQIKGVPYFMEAGDTSILDSGEHGGPEISLRAIAPDVNPHRVHDAPCRLASPAAPRR